MKRIAKLIHLISVATLAISAAILPAKPLASMPNAYLEPALGAYKTGPISVIVTGTNSQAAERAVKSLGGQVTSDLWLIDAVAATFPAERLQQLASFPDVLSVVKNKGVAASDEPVNPDGWVTERRIKKGTYTLADVQEAPAAFLPDGGFVSIARGGQVLIANADGSERVRVNLSGGPFKTASVVAGVDGTIFVAGEAKLVYALNPNGQVRWVFRGAREKFRAGISLGPDGTVYVADEKRNLYALDPGSGQMNWQSTVGSDGVIMGTPTLATDGTIYTLTDKGHLFALDPSGNVNWAFRSSAGAPFLFSPQLGADGTVYIAGQEKL